MYTVILSSREAQCVCVCVCGCVWHAILQPLSPWESDCLWFLFLPACFLLSKSLILLLFNTGAFFFSSWLCWVFVAACGLSLVVASGGYSLVAVRGPLTVVVFCCGAQGLGTWALVAAVHGLRCPAARGILLDQGSNSCPLRWQADS